jgi:GT2 family glycosyltransferase
MSKLNQEVDSTDPDFHSGAWVLDPGPRAPTLQGRMRVAGKSLARHGATFRVRGVTYGPFTPDAAGQPFPAPGAVANDLTLMRGAGINAIRTYHVPPEWLLSLADEQEMAVFSDVPWPKHLCFLDNAQAQKDARQAVRRAAERGRHYPCLLAYGVGNEIPSDIVRWYGARRVERFLSELRDVAKQADPLGLVTYANYPPTEYLDLSFLDFVTFNVYLHDRETFRRYLLRLQNLVGDRPLVLGEIGMDTCRHGELAQADFLAGHVREATLLGLAGVFIFSWTDEWHTGGYLIEDWAFGITNADRVLKASYHALGDVFASSPAQRLPQTPRVSVVVCTYNGARTLDQCLRSLGRLDYPDYEVIVVDDGSTDNTPDILARYPDIRAIRQENRGLSNARNAGLHLATGSVVAYTDSDCFADPDWLTHLVDQLERIGAAAVGGPNLTPEDGWMAACVAASPGQPTHVLESDQVAEHIPGCNMAFRREALLAINGFDPQFRKAGDDVDVCWRLQQAGRWITFAPGAFVWHHRRQTPRTYLWQQAGYGQAEALLRFKHPGKFNGRGDGKWRGVLYGAALQGLRVGSAMIYRGTFGTGMFQCLYQPGPAHWAMLPSTLEWHAAALLVGLSAFAWPAAALVAGLMLALSLLVAALQAAQARPPAPHDGIKARALVAVLSYLQPLVRSWARYRTRLFAYRPPELDPALAKRACERLPLSGRHETSYWTEEGYGRTEFLGLVIAYLNERGWGKVIDSGWSDWDVKVYSHPWTIVEVCTAQEDHGSNKHLIRVRYRLRPAWNIKAVGTGALICAVAAAIWLYQPLAASAAFLMAFCTAIWWYGTRQASRVPYIFDLMAGHLGLIRCKPTHEAGAQGAAAEPEPQEDLRTVNGRCKQVECGEANAVATELTAKARTVS